MVGKKKNQFKFDAALSFAGEDRTLAEAVARAAQNIGLRIFYDKDHHSYLWGKNRSEYEKIYGSESAFVVPFISKSYVAREWPQYEFETAKKEAAKRRSEFILPIKIDESRQFGLLSDHNYLEASEFSPEEFAKAIKSKVDSLTVSRKRSSGPGAKVTILTEESRLALGIITTAPVGMPVKSLISFFPKIPWRKHVAQFRRDNLIEDEFVIVPEKEIRRKLRSETLRFKEVWISRLEELTEHVDCALLLGLEYLSQGRFEDAVVTLGKIAVSMEPNWWIISYRKLFQRLNQSKILRQLSPESRLLFHQAYGHCLAGTDSGKIAREQFKRARTLAVKQKDFEVVGIAILNIGVSYHNEGRDDIAMKWYERAHEHGKKYSLKFLMSCALGNLGQISVEHDPESAITLLFQSLEYKKAEDASEGIAIVTQSLAVAYSELEEFETAFRYFDEAAMLARQMGMQHLESVLLTNWGLSLSQSGKRAAAISHLKKALRVADAEGFVEIELQASKSLAQIQFELGRLPDAQSTLQTLLDLGKELEDRETIMLAHHGLWVVISRRGDLLGARKHYLSLLRIARKEESVSWLSHALIEKAQLTDSGEFCVAKAATLTKLIQSEEKRLSPSAAGALWYESSLALSENDSIEPLLQAIHCFQEDGESTDELIVAYKRLSLVYWELGKHDESIELVRSVNSIAKLHGLSVEQVSTLDHEGYCLQELGQFEAAIPLHQAAAKQAEDFGLLEQAFTCYHNLGECFRQLAKSSKARSSFKKAGTIARKLKDEELLIENDHAQALVHVDEKKFQTAESLFKSCATKARKIGCHLEEVRALEALANLSWTRGRKGTAKKQYERALIAAQKFEMSDQSAKIAFNLARLLKVLGDRKTALKTLLNNPSDSGDFHSLLAELLEEAKRIEEARHHWQAALQAAEKSGDSDEVDYVTALISKFEKRQSKLKLPIKDLESILRGRLSVQRRSDALKALLEKLLEQKSERKAEEVFEAAQKHMKKHGLVADLVDVYLALFDHNWNGDRNSKLEALKWYIGLVMVVAESSETEDLFGTVFVHITYKLSLGDGAPSLNQLEWLESNFTEFLAQFDAGASVMKMLTYPLVYAKRIVSVKDDPGKLMAMCKMLAAGDSMFCDARTD